MEAHPVPESDRLCLLFETFKSLSLRVLRSRCLICHANSMSRDLGLVGKCTTPRFDQATHPRSSLSVRPRPRTLHALRSRQDLAWIEGLSLQERGLPPPSMASISHVDKTFVLKTMGERNIRGVDQLSYRSAYKDHKFLRSLHPP